MGTIKKKREKQRGGGSEESVSPSVPLPSATNLAMTSEDQTLVPNFQMASVCLASSPATIFFCSIRFPSEWFVFLICSLRPDKIQQLAQSSTSAHPGLCEVCYKPVNHPDFFHHSILIKKVSTVFFHNFGISLGSIYDWRHFALTLASIA